MAQSILLRRFLRSRKLATFWSVVAFLVIVALAGGSSRATSLGQVVVRSVATLAAGGWLAFVRSSGDRSIWPGFAFLGACAALICIQLVPLPPSWWQSLPGRDAYAAAAAIADPVPHWRPISLAPDLTWSSLFALLIPAALFIGLSRLSSLQRADLMLPIVVLIFASGVLGLAQVTGGPDSVLRWYGGNPDPSAIGFLANRNHQALLLACALPILAALASAPASDRNRRSVFRWGALSVAAFIMLMLPTTGSRAGLVLGAFAILFAVAIAAPSMQMRLSNMRRRRRRWFMAGGIGAVLGFIAILVFLGQNVAFSRIATLDPLTDQRVRAFPVVLHMTRLYLPLGIGFGTFDPVFRHFEPFNLLKLTYFNQAHNDLLQLVLEGGIFAALLFILFFTWWISATIRAWRTEPSIQTLAARAGSAIIIMCMMASIVDYPVRTPLLLSIFSVAAIWMLAPHSSRNGADVVE